MTHSRFAQDHLAGWRKKKGITLAQVADATKISTRYLEAIERGRFRALPGGVYGLSYIRQYAQAIHYEEAELVKFYRSTLPPEVDPVAPVVVTPAGRLLGRLRSLRGDNKPH